MSHPGPVTALLKRSTPHRGSTFANTTLVKVLANSSTFRSFLGQLDSNGRATASLVVPGGIGPFPAFTLHHAYSASDAGRFFFANPYPGTASSTGVIPVNHPSGASFTPDINLGEWISFVANFIALQYNAGLIGKAIEENVGTSTGGGDPEGVEMRSEYDIKLNSPPDCADELQFDAFDRDAEVNGWCIAMDTFASIQCRN